MLGNSRRALVVAAAVLVVAASGGAARGSHPGSYGRSPSGCPSFAAGPGYTDEPDASPPEAGGFGRSHMKVQGATLQADAGELAISVQVEDMKRQTDTGFRWTYWEVTFRGPDRSRSVKMYYDRTQDEYSYWLDVPLTPLHGSVREGPGGGITAVVPLEKVNLKPGSVISSVRVSAGNFVSYVYMQPPNYLTGTYPSGVYQTMWARNAHDVFPIAACPGIAATVLDAGFGQGVLAEGYLLPQEADRPVALEVRDGEGWRAVANDRSFGSGEFTLRAPLPPGSYELRVSAAASTGVVTSSPQPVTVTP